MTRPTPAEIEDYCEQLRMQASFLRDPALIEALSFIDRLVSEPVEDTKYPRSSYELSNAA